MSFFPFEICVAKSIEDPHPTRTPHSESRGFHPPLSSQADIRTETRLNHRERHAPVPDGEVSRRGAEAQRRGIGRVGMQKRQSCLPSFLGQPKTDTPKKNASGHRPYPPKQPGRKRHRDLCGRLSGSRMGRARAEALRRRGGIESAGNTGASELFSATALASRRRLPPIPRIGMHQDIDPTHPNNLVENATAFSAGGSPAPRWGGLAQRYRACFIYVSGLRLSEKVDGEGSSGSGALSASVSKGRGMGFGHEKPGSATVLLRC